MTFELKNAVIHEIIREDNDIPSLNLANQSLDVTNAIPKNFIETIVESFRSKAPSLGVFQSDSRTYPFQDSLIEYLDSDYSFLEYSKLQMTILEKEIQVPKAKGGYVVFAEYTIDAAKFHIIVMLDMKQEFAINTDDEGIFLTQLEALNIKNIARAARIDIRGFLDDAELYLSFIKGTRNVSDYFQDFIGSTDLYSAKQNIRNLRFAIKEFAKDNEWNDEKHDNTWKTIHEYLHEQLRNKLDVELSAISAKIDSSNPQKFQDFVVGHREINVSGFFRISKLSDLKPYVSNKIKGSGFVLTFDQELVQNKKIEQFGNGIIIREVEPYFLDKHFKKLEN